MTAWCTLNLPYHPLPSMITFNRSFYWLVVYVLWHINLWDYLTPNPFLCKKSVLFKQSSLAWVRSLIVKNISISNYSVYSNNTNSANFVYTQLNLKTVLYITIQFSVSRFSTSKVLPFQTIQFSISMHFKCKYSLIVKNISTSSCSV